MTRFCGRGRSLGLVTKTISLCTCDSQMCILENSEGPDDMSTNAFAVIIEQNQNFSRFV